GAYFVDRVVPRRGEVAPPGCCSCRARGRSLGRPGGRRRCARDADDSRQLLHERVDPGDAPGRDAGRLDERRAHRDSGRLLLGAHGRPGGCVQLPLFQLNGPGASIVSDMNGGEVDASSLNAFFLPNSTYTWHTDRGLASAVHTFTTSG